MVSVIPGTSASDAQGAMKILQAVSTDAQYKERLQDLISKAEEATNALANLQAAKGDAEKKLQAAETMKVSIEKEAKAIMDRAQEAKKEVDERLAYAAAREGKLAVAIKDHEEKVKRQTAAIEAARATHEAAKAAAVKDLDEQRAALQATREGLHKLVATFAVEHEASKRKFDALAGALK